MLALQQTGYAPVAQLDRVLASEAKGRGFDSRRARHFIKTIIEEPLGARRTMLPIAITA